MKVEMDVKKFVKENAYYFPNQKYYYLKHDILGIYGKSIEQLEEKLEEKLSNGEEVNKYI